MFLITSLRKAYVADELGIGRTVAGSFLVPFGLDYTIHNL